MKKATQKSSPNHVSQHDCINLGVLSHIESRFIPHTPTKARLLLEILSDGLVHSTSDLMFGLGADPRAALQDLTGDRYGYWRIVNLAGHSKMGQYELDQRHLSSLDGEDSRARNEAQLAYRKHSRKVAENGLERHEKAVELEQQAQAKVDADKCGPHSDNSYIYEGLHHA
jgi:hypothetical protein